MKDENVTADSNVDKIINDMNAGWRNTISQALNLDPNTFQLAQGTLGLQTSDSSGLFQMANGVPPKSVAAFYDASSGTKRSDSYAMLLNALASPTGSGLQQALGPKYADWVTFKSQNFTKYKTVMEMFDAFAMGYLDTNQSKAGRAVIAGEANNPLMKAQNAVNDPAYYTTFVDDAGNNFSLPTYSATITVAQTAINTGGSATIDYNSATASTSSNGTTVSGSASGFYDIFYGGAGGSFDQLNKKAASSDFTITGKVGQYATVPTVAADWFNGAMVTKAFNAKNDFNVWDANSNSGDWDSFFNQQTGSLARRVSELVLVSDVDLTVTSTASYSDSEFQQIKTNASFGIWPFFSAKASATHTLNVSHNNDGTLSVHYVIDKGKIAIWGVNIQDAPQ